jgi:uncharacterized membrane protein HdeD (DUF308 family)
MRPSLMATSASHAVPLDTDDSVGRFWWMPLAAGVLTMIVGILALAYPGPTLLVICVILGVYLLISGGMTLVRGIGGERGLTTLMRVLLVLLGLLSLLAGLIVLVRPGESVLTIAWVLGFWWVLTGAMQFIGGIVEAEGRGWNIALGLLGIVAGGIILAQPGIGLATLVWIVGLGLLFRGAAEIAVGLAIRKLHHAGAL